jgi:very-short-patch-repair endonuclease
MDQTPAERHLWDLLRNREFSGLKFRRQHPLGTFIADFYCPKLRVAIELDGAVHDDSETRQRDRQRDELLAGRGVRVLRISNTQLETDPQGTLALLLEVLAEPPLPRPSPSSRKGDEPQ